ncbi:MAG: hypothetical protein WA829_14365 [Candidatus Acidiferrum sp.]
MMHCRRTATFTFLFATLTCLVVTGCRKPIAKLSAGSGSASFEAPNQLLTSLAIFNTGEGAAEDIKVTSISIPGATLTLPASLPLTLGTIPADSSSILDANFSDASAQAGTSYTVVVAGTFVEHGHQFKFSLDETVRTLPASPGSAVSSLGSSPPFTVSGAHFPAQKPNFGNEVNEGGLARQIPTGPFRPLIPSKESAVEPAPNGKGGGAGTGSINFPTNDPLGISSSTVAEPSGASGGGVVFESANWFAAVSTNGGAHFTQLNPTTIFPNTADGGFCCDQIVQYAPSIDRFIWIMQFGEGTLSTDPPGLSTGTNRYRIAVASPATVKSSGGTSWTYWDITSPQINGASATTTWFDYPDASIGDNSLYLSADNALAGISAGKVTTSNAGHVVIRIPLSELQSGSTINFRFTTPSDSSVAWGGHVSQNTRDEVFWAGHNSNSSIRVFNWLESSNNYNWQDISIGTWPKTSSSNLMTSVTPDSQDWLAKLSGFPGNAVLGLVRSSAGGDNKRVNQIFLAWTGAIGNGFKQPQVQWITLDRNNNFALVNQQQVWNPGYAYAYPAFAVNTNNEIGMSLEWGGGGNYENHVAGFWGDFVVYATTSSNIGTTRFGDYVTIRQNSADATKFDAFGYGLDKTTPPGGTTVDVHYIIFSR